MSVTLYNGDCLQALKRLPDQSIDSVVTDPPYGLSATAKNYGLSKVASIWDYDVPSVEIWQEVLRVMKPGAHLVAFSGTRTYHRMVVNVEDAGFEIRDQIGWIYSEGMPKGRACLKPSWEPAVLARAPMVGSTPKNVAAFGTGTLNIEECRIETEEKLVRPAVNRSNDTVFKSGLGAGVQEEPEGRWPANVIHDGSDAVLEEMGEYARFYYAAKASKRERNGTQHPTVKPVKLMRYLCRMITPKGGIVLDPFAGSGSTGQAAIEEGFGAVLMERDATYCDDIRRRLALWLEEDIILDANIAPP